MILQVPKELIAIFEEMARRLGVQVKDMSKWGEQYIVKGCNLFDYEVSEEDFHLLKLSGLDGMNYHCPYDHQKKFIVYVCQV